MAGRVDWHGAEEERGIAEGVQRNIRAASIYLANVIKADISQPGTLRSGRKKTVSNFTHSAPGNPPYKQTGRLRASIAWEQEGLVGRVGTNVRYGLYLERGTHRMARRPFLVRNYNLHLPALRAILEARITPGGVGPIAANQFRSGVLGAGARKFGFA